MTEIQIQISDPKLEDDPERKEALIKINYLNEQIVRILYHSGLNFADAWTVVCNVVRSYIQSREKYEHELLIQVLLAIARTEIVCSDCMKEEAETATKH
jgi:hypothetical protein